jgi:uncharacterized membrane protein
MSVIRMQVRGRRHTAFVVAGLAAVVGLAGLGVVLTNLV